jgi:hypothetical protein
MQKDKRQGSCTGEGTDFVAGILLLTISKILESYFSYLNSQVLIVKMRTMILILYIDLSINKKIYLFQVFNAELGTQ